MRRSHAQLVAWTLDDQELMLSALLKQSFGAYVAVLPEESGWSMTALSGAAALQPVESAIMGPALGLALDRFGPQGTIRLGMAISAMGFIGLSQIDSLAGFYVCAVMLAIGASLGGYFPLTVALIQWFERHHARALSMHHYGWCHTAMGSGVIALLLGLPLASVIRRRPQDHGETMDGLPPASAASVDALPSNRPAQVEFTASQALRTRVFWLLALGHAAGLLFLTFATHVLEVAAFALLHGLAWGLRGPFMQAFVRPRATMPQRSLMFKATGEHTCLIRPL